MGKWLEIAKFLLSPVPPAPQEETYGQRYMPREVTGPDPDERGTLGL